MKYFLLLTPFTITPSFCEVTYACDEITRTHGLTNSYISCVDSNFDGNFDGSTDLNGKITDRLMTFSADSDDYTNDGYPPSEFEITIKGTATDSGDEVPIKITIFIKDPCYPPESTTPPGFVDQSYVLTKILADFEPNDFTI